MLVLDLRVDLTMTDNQPTCAGQGSQHAVSQRIMRKVGDADRDKLHHLSLGGSNWSVKSSTKRGGHSTFFGNGSGGVLLDGGINSVKSTYVSLAQDYVLLICLGQEN